MIIKNGDILATTHRAVHPKPAGTAPQRAPAMVCPDKGAAAWEHIDTVVVCDNSGVIHFFWFWREVR